MRSSRPGRALRLYEVLSSPRTTIVFLAGLLGILVLSLAIGQEATDPQPLSEIYSPDVLYRLRSLGLTQLFESGWFMSVAIGLALNQLLIFVNRFPKAWTEARAGILGGIEAGASSVSVSSKIGREEFRESVQALGRARLGRFTKLIAIRDEGGLNELLLGAERGRIGVLALPLALIGTFFVATGIWLQYRGGLKGEIAIEERQRTSLIRVISGDPEKAGRWSPVEKAGTEGGFSQMDFELWFERFDPLTGTAWLEISRAGEKLGTSSATRGKPQHFNGLSWTPIRSHKSGKFAARVTVRDRRGLEPEREIEANRGEPLAAPGGVFKVIDAREQIEGLGAAAQIEYVENGKTPVQFWIFEKAPQFDEVHRKLSRAIFVMHQVLPRYEILLAVTREPGAVWTLIGAILWTLAAVIGFWIRRERWWFSWEPERIKIAAVRKEEPGFGPIFDQMTRAWLSRLGRKDTSLRGKRWEVRSEGT